MKNNLGLTLFVLICAHLHVSQERWAQQTDQDLPPRWEVRLLRPTNVHICGGAHLVLSAPFPRGVQRHTRHQVDSSCVTATAG